MTVFSVVVWVKDSCLKLGELVIEEHILPALSLLTYLLTYSMQQSPS